MARPKKDAAIDLSEAQELTAGLIERLTCRTDIKAQAFLRDTKAPGLRVRVTNTGAKSFVFEAKLNRQTIRRTIGDARAWTIEAARTEANRLRVTLDAGTDPREVQRQQDAEKATSLIDAAAKVDADKLAGVTVGEVWKVYIEVRKPKWSDRHYLDHKVKADPGGKPSKRGGPAGKKTTPGPLATLMTLPLRDLTAPAIDAWAATEAAKRPTSARLSWRLLKAFLGWCEEQPEYAALLPAKNPAKTKRSREALGKPQIKQDALRKEQLSAWFDAVTKIDNPVVAAALQTVLLTGARPGEVLSLQWDDLNIRWRGLTIRDKVEGTREIPLTPYVHRLIAALPRRNEYVFSGARAQVVANPMEKHAAACAVAGIDGLTLHGLRRSFKSLTEWLEIPAGVVAQLMGHKPSATAEKHYTVRPLDLLRVHHEKIESWILDQAGVTFDAAVEPGALRVVTAAA